MLVPLEPPKRDVTFADEANEAKIRDLNNKLNQLDSSSSRMEGAVLDELYKVFDNGKKLVPIKQKALDLCKELARLGGLDDANDVIEGAKKELAFYQALVRDVGRIMKQGN